MATVDWPSDVPFINFDFTRKNPSAFRSTQGFQGKIFFQAYRENKPFVFEGYAIYDRVNAAKFEAWFLSTDELDGGRNSFTQTISAPATLTGDTTLTFRFLNNPIEESSKVSNPNTYSYPFRLYTETLYDQDELDAFAEWILQFSNDYLNNAGAFDILINEVLP